MQDVFNDLDTGWSWAVMVACFVGNFVCGGTNYLVGLIHTTLLDTYHESQSTTAWVGALHTSIMNMAAPISSVVVDRFSVRTAVITSGILYTTGYMVTAFAPSLGLTIFSCGIISGLGGAVGWTASMVALGFHFRRYRNLAQGIAVSGSAAGILGITPILQLAKNMFGSTGFFITLSCITLQQVVAGTAMIPSKLEKHSQRKRLEESHRKEKSKKSTSLLRQYFRVFTTKSIFCLTLSMFALCYGTLIVFMYLPNYCLQNGVTDMQAAYIISTCGAASLVGRFMTGVATNNDKIDDVLLYSITSIVSALATLLFPLYSKSFTGQIAYAVIFGLCFGSPYVLITPINISFVGVDKMTKALATEFSFGGMGTIIGTVLTGFILDAGGTYELAFIIAGASILISAALAMASTLVGKRSYDDGVTTKEMEIEIEQSPDSMKMLKDTTK